MAGSHEVDTDLRQRLQIGYSRHNCCS